MTNWNLEIMDGLKQTEEERSFIGGKPNIPPEIVIPQCSMCNSELTFMFQIEFPMGHSWHGKSLAVFFCTTTFHDEFCIPEFPDVQDLFGVDITADFLRHYARNFRVIVFDTAKGKVRENYEEKVAFKKLRISSTNCIDSRAIFVLGGDPIWIMGIDETPRSIDGREPTLLLQVKEDFLFQTIESAPPQETIMKALREDGNYQLFASDRIYFWGVKDKSIPLVYITVQSP